MMKKYNAIELLRDIAGKLDIALFIVVPDGTIAFSSLSAQSGTDGTTPPADIDALMETLTLSPAVRTEIVEFLHTADGDSRYAKVFQKDTEKEKRHLQLTAVPILFEDNSAVAIQVRDITAEQMLFREIEKLERMASAGQLAAGIAHEFNNILTAMMGWTQLAIRSCEGNQPALDALETIENNMRRARRIAGDLLEIARPDDTRKNPSVSVDTAVQEALKLLTWDLSNAHIRTYTSIETTRPCRGSMTRLVQVFVNIIRNAIDATPSFGSLEVIVAQQADGVTASFADTGTGIPEEAIGNVFKPFFTTKVRGEGVHGGSGLGLSVSQKTIEEFGGTIDVRNREQGGTVVTVTLPFAAPHSDSAAIARSPSTFSPGVAVLVVDDEPDICEMIRTALSLRGAHVVSAISGEQALELCRREMFNAAFVDYSMNGLSGHDLGRALDRIQPKLPIVYMSGVNIPANGETTFDFLKKPFDLHEIQVTLRRILDRVS